MPIPMPKISIQLKKNDQPDTLTPENLQKQLRDIGLSCKYTEIPQLKKFIATATKELPDGKCFRFALLSPKRQIQEKAQLMGVDFNELAHSRSIIVKDKDQNQLGEFVIEKNKGTWSPIEPNAFELQDNAWDPTYAYIEWLSVVSSPVNFDYLREHKPGFTQRSDYTAVSKRKLADSTVEGIRKAFVDITSAISSKVLNGLNKEDLKGILRDRLAPLSSQKDFEQQEPIITAWVQDPDGKYASAIGAVCVKWKLEITNYKEKKSDPHQEAHLTTSIYAVQYSDIKMLCEDCKAILPGTDCSQY